MSLFVRGLKYTIRLFCNWIRFRKAQLLWLRSNRHNKTRMGNYFPPSCVSVGRYTYGKLIVHHFGAENEGLVIGDFCSIGPDVEFFLGGEHHPLFISNYPFGLYIKGMEKYEKYDRTSKGKIVIGDDVWLGAHSIVLSGVHIGQGAIIGAGSVVAKDIPPYGIYANGRIVKYRFSEQIVEQLTQIDFSKIDANYLNSHRDVFYSEDVENNMTELPRKE